LQPMVQAAKSLLQASMLLLRPRDCCRKEFSHACQQQV
jgi:hypothetical protein